jgi:hypothetical protein
MSSSQATESTLQSLELSEGRATRRGFLKKKRVYNCSNPQESTRNCNLPVTVIWLFVTDFIFCILILKKVLHPHLQTPHLDSTEFSSLPLLASPLDGVFPKETRANSHGQPFAFPRQAPERPVQHVSFSAHVPPSPWVSHTQPVYALRHFHLPALPATGLAPVTPLLPAFARRRRNSPWQRDPVRGQGCRQWLHRPDRTPLHLLGRPARKPEPPQPSGASAADGRQAEPRPRGEARRGAALRAGRRVQHRGPRRALPPRPGPAGAGIGGQDSGGAASPPASAIYLRGQGHGPAASALRCQLAASGAARQGSLITVGRCGSAARAQAAPGRRSCPHPAALLLGTRTSRARAGVQTPSPCARLGGRRRQSRGSGRPKVPARMGSARPPPHPRASPARRPPAPREPRPCPRAARPAPSVRRKGRKGL